MQFTARGNAAINAPRAPYTKPPWCWELVSNQRRVALRATALPLSYPSTLIVSSQPIRLLIGVESGSRTRLHGFADRRLAAKLSLLVGREGFEPSRPFRRSVLQTDAFNQTLPPALGADSRTRTHHPLFTGEPLYLMSYVGILSTLYAWLVCDEPRIHGRSCFSRPSTLSWFRVP